MTGETERLERGAIETIPIHFDLPGHQIPLSTFIRTAQQTEAVIRTLNHKLFDGKLQYEIFLLPPEEGTFKSILGLVLLGWGVVWSFTESDIGKAFILGLTTHEPAHWAEVVGTGVRKQLIDAAESTETEAEGDDHAAKRQYSAVIVAEATKSFLQKEVSDLEKVGITPTRFRDAFEARNEFYQACSETLELRGIGFEDVPRFPIDRSGFKRLQVALPPKEEDAEEPWLTSVATLKVTSPNWDRDDRQRFWKGKDGNGRERLFRIDDEHFWSLVKAERLRIHIIDRIKVQWAFHGKAENPKNIRVLKVLEFNDQVLSEPLDENGLIAILGRYTKALDGQWDLFNDQT